MSASFNPPVAPEYKNVKIKVKVGIDWSGCEIVEVNPRKVSGVPIIKGTRSS
jgi:uncharacterized protein (DUF433 family)